MAQTSPEGQPETTVNAPTRRWRRWLRRVVWLVVLIPVVLVGLVLIVGQTRVMKLVVEPILESQLGVEMSSGSITLSPAGKIVISDAVFSTDLVDGEAGRLIEIDRATININWLGLLRGSGQVSSIVIEHPLVRLSQATGTGRLNLAAMDLKQDGGGGPTPAIQIRRGVLQIGEHEGGKYTLLKAFSLEGRIGEQDDKGVSAFEFAARPTEPGVGEPGVRSPGSFGLIGEIGPDGIDGSLDGVRLQDWPGAYIPSRSRGMYERLGLAGELAPTRFHISEDGQIEVVLTLDGVALNLPFDDTGSMTGPGDLLRMRRTRGTITFGTRGLNAELRGLIDDLEYGVTLTYSGLDASSPFGAVLVTDFRLDDRFRPAKFLPENVLSKLDRFEHPVADVHARVVVSREAGEEIKVSGRATLSNGSAIYKKFRYPFHDLHGSVSFEPDRLVIEDITGVGPTGATLRARGLFSPLGEDSVVTLNLSVDEVPVDEHLMRALDPGQQQLVDALFSKESYQRLLDEGLLLEKSDRHDLGQLRREVWDRLDGWKDGIDGDESDRAGLALELSDLDRRLSVPDFSFAGLADVDVVLRRHPERPEDDRWTTDVRVKLPTAGLVPGHFPLPIVAHDVEITIGEDRVELTGGTYTGLSGGTARVQATIDRTQADAKPVVKVTARRIPIDQRLIAAIPGYHDKQSADPDDISLRRILDRLRLSGVIECDADIGPRGDGRLGYDVEATILEGTARPVYTPAGLGAGDSDSGNDSRGNDDDVLGVPLGGDPLALSDLYGTVYVTEELIVVDLDGMLSSPEQPIAPTRVEVLTQLTLPNKTRSMGGVRREGGLLPTDFGPPVPGPELYATARADGIDLAMPLQHAVAVVSPRIARDLMAYKAQYNPDGVLSVSAQLEGFVAGSIDSSFTLDGIERLSFDFDHTRYRVGPSWGQATFTRTDQPALAFEGFRIPIETDGSDAGTLSLDGTLPLRRDGAITEITQPSALRITYENGTLDSPVSRGVIDRLASSENKSWFSTHEIHGRYDLDVTLSPQPGVYWSDGPGERISMLPMLINGQLLPKTFELRTGEEVARFEGVTGAVSFDGYKGTFDQIRARDGGTSLALDGSWSMAPGAGLGVDITVDASGALLTGPVRAVLPDAVDRVIDSLQIKALGDVVVDDMSIVASAMGRPEGEFTIRGRARINEGSAVIGLPITGLTGDLGFTVHGTGTTLGYELDLGASRLRAGLLRVYDAKVQLIGDANNPGVVLIPEIIAGMHGGRIAGSAQIRPGQDAVPWYWMELHASGVRAAPVFDDLLLPPEGIEGPPLPGESVVLSSWSRAADLSRGAMIGDLTLTGPIGNPDRRVGRGTVQIAGGSVLALPGLINLIEVSNLSLPTGATIDLAEASFYVDGPVLAFEQLSASSRKVEIAGYGTMNWDSRRVDLRFNTRSINPIPIISGLFETLRDELITTRVTGEIGAMKYSVQQFSGTKRLLGALLGNDETDQQRRMRQVEQQVYARKARRRPSDSDRVHLPDGSAFHSWDWDRPDREPAPAPDPVPPPSTPPTPALVPATGRR